MDVAKKVFRFLSSILFYSVVLILVIALLMFVASFIDKKISMKNGENKSSLFGAYIIISNSMVPNINVYDAVLTVRVDPYDIEKYDIITFISKEIKTAGTPITHRVVDIVHDPEDETKIIGFRTKGDHNNTEDFALIAPDEVLGRVFLRIPMIGYLQTIMTKPIGWLLIVVIPCLLIIGNDIFKLVKSSKQKKEEESTSELVISSENSENQSLLNKNIQTEHNNFIDNLNNSNIISNQFEKNEQNLESNNDITSTVTSNFENSSETETNDVSDKNKII